MNVDSYKDIKVLAVDADIICYRVSAMCEDSHVKVLYDAIDDYIKNIAKDSGVEDMIFFISSETNFRYDVAKSKPYKGTRKNIIRPYFLLTAKSYITTKYSGFAKDNYEADDCIASFMTKYDNVAHAGIDKDIKQICGWHYNFVKKEWDFVSEDEATLRLFRQICQGDAGDNIPGLPRIGEVKAREAVQNPYKAMEEAFALYEKVLKTPANALGKTKDELDTEILEYFNEQSLLITMVDDLDIPYFYVTIKVPQMFETGFSDGWVSESVEYVHKPKPEYKPKLTL